MKASKKKEPLEREKKEIARDAEEEKVGPVIEKEIEKQEEKEKKEIKEEKEEKQEEKQEITEAKLSPEERRKREIAEKLASWKPKTEIGKLVKEGVITNIDEVLAKGRKILEPEIIDALIDWQYELIAIGQAKGKFGGGKRRAWRQTQKKTAEGNVPKFSAFAIVGDANGHIGYAMAKAKETLPAREKAIRKAKLNIFKVPRGCGSFDCICNEPHSIPLAIEAKCGSVRVKLMPAPRGAGLVADEEIKKIFRLVGIKDIYVKSFGKTRTKYNHAKAILEALRKLNKYVSQ